MAECGIKNSTYLIVKKTIVYLIYDENEPVVRRSPQNDLEENRKKKIRVEIKQPRNVEIFLFTIYIYINMNTCSLTCAILNIVQFC